VHNKKLISILSLSGLGGVLYASSPWNSFMNNTKSFCNLLTIIAKDNIQNFLSSVEALGFDFTLTNYSSLLKSNQNLFSQISVSLFDIALYVGFCFMIASFLFLIKKLGKILDSIPEEASIFSIFTFKPILTNSDFKKDKRKINFIEDEYLRNNPDVTLFKDYNSLVGRVHQGQIPISNEGNEDDKYYYEKDVEDEGFKIFIKNAFKDSTTFVSD